MCVLAGVGLSFGTIAIDRAYDYELILQSISGGPDAALEILGTVAASMVSLAALVLTITMVVVQLAMGQFSPRIVQRILQDKPSQLAIGTFVGTFAHAMLTLREVQTGSDEVVPGVAVILAFVLVIISIMVLVWYVNHIGRSLRVTAQIELVGTDTRKLLDRLYVDAAETRSPKPPAICAPHSGVVTQIDYKELVRIAETANCVLTLLHHWASLSPQAHRCSRLRGHPIGSTPRRRCAQSNLAPNGLLTRMWPTTAVQAIDRLHDCLRQLAPRSFPDGRFHDEKGELRLVTASMTWEDYVHLAFDEIRMAGAGSPQVARRLRAALEDLLTIAPEERQNALKEQLALLQSGIESTNREGKDRADSKRGDARGLG